MPYKKNTKKTCPTCGNDFIGAPKQMFCCKHCRMHRTFNRLPKPIMERFMGFVDVQPDGCWRWTGAITESGYGVFQMGPRSTKRAHRVSHELFKGPIPEELEIDHTCHPNTCTLGAKCPHRRCVNPDHLNPATTQENCSPERSSNVHGAHFKAKTHCPQGHEYSDINTRTFKGSRFCRKCAIMASRKYRAKKKLPSSSELSE